MWKVYKDKHLLRTYTSIRYYRPVGINFSELEFQISEYIGDD